MLDKLGALETWQTTADASLGTLLEQSSTTATRVEETVTQVAKLDFRPPPPPPRGGSTGYAGYAPAYPAILETFTVYICVFLK